MDFPAMVCFSTGLAIDVVCATENAHRANLVVILNPKTTKMVCYMELSYNVRPSFDS